MPVNRPDYVFKGIPNPFWISGFTSGDGSFYLSVFKQNSKFTENVSKIVRLNFKICLNIREEAIIKGLFNYLFSSYLLKKKGEHYKNNAFALQVAEPILENKSTRIYTSLKENSVTLLKIFWYCKYNNTIFW